SHFDFEKPLVELESRIRALREALTSQETTDADLRELEVRAERLQREIYGHLEPWQKVQLSRHPARPYFLDYAEVLFEDLVELHGDESFRDDAAIVAGFAKFRGRPVAVVGHQKGRGTREKVARNFGMAHPEGYRKAMRVMQLASRFGRPIFTFIDTPG